MIFELNSWLMNPLVLMLLAVLSGLAFGKVKFGKFNFGISGTLFTGLLIGWAVVKYANRFSASHPDYSRVQQFLVSGIIPKGYFYLFLILFIAAVGLLASDDVETVLRKYGVKFMALGFLITFSGAATTYGMSQLLTNVFQVKASPYEITGVYTGALTSSPGLAAAMETASDYAKSRAAGFSALSEKKKRDVLELIDDSVKPANSGELTKEQQENYCRNAESGVSVGHAIGYPFGVIIVIFAVNFFPALFRINLADEYKRFDQEMRGTRHFSNASNEQTGFDLIAFIIVMIVGYSFGKVGIKLNFIGLNQTFSLGATGGVLINALLFGYIGKIGPLNFRMDTKVLTVIRQIGLAFFLAIVGLRYGFSVFDALAGSGIILAFVGLVVGLVAMLTGFFVGRYVFKMNWIMLSGAICGGMTSTPGLGAAIDALQSDDPASGYGAAYPFGLLGVVIFSIILHILPM